jgi:putative drug exporter of the RND superfamily
VVDPAHSVGTMAKPKGFSARVAVWSARHRALAIIGWLALVAVVTVLSGQIGVEQANKQDHGHGESGRADHIVANAGFPKSYGEMVLVKHGTRTLDDPGFAETVRAVTVALDATGVARDRTEPVPSADRHAVLVQFQLEKEDQVDATLAAVAAVARAHPGYTVAEAGSASGDKYIGEELDRGFNRLSLLSLPLTLGILLVAFGALVAALLPVALTVTAVIAATGLLAFASRFAPTVDATTHVMLLVGLAVGVDYCLFYIRREREERARGADPHRALVVAAQTSGRSIWVSGLTVIVAMAGMLFTRDVTFVSFAVGTILVVATAVAGSLTVLPAVLSLLGDKVDFSRIPGLYRRRSTGRAWRAVLTVVLRRPLVSAVLAVVALGALATPALRMHTRSESIDDFSDSVPTVATLKQIRAAFPGGDEPAYVVISAPDVRSGAVAGAIERFRAVAKSTGQLHEPISVEVNPAGTVAVVSVGLSGAGTDAESDRALGVLRGTVVPSVFGDVLRDVPGATVAVTGETAGSHDFNATLKRSLPLVFLFVLGLTFGLVLLSFRSIVVAATTIGLNLLSVAAAYGLLVLVFQDGHGERLLDFTSTGGITDWLPLFLFVILFGLSMDYHVFVLSRIREGYDRGLRTRQAVADGIAGTAGVITSAAVVMVAVFALFATMPLVSTKQAGFGLATAVLIDATVIRAVLLPAVMALLGERNWYLPRWLNWLPKLPHSPADDGPAPAAPAPAAHTDDLVGAGRA